MNSAENLHWEVAGEGQDLVLVHGWGMNGGVWEHSVSILQHHFRVHVVDLPGYGYSSHLPAESLEEIAKYLMYAAPKQSIWVGWSLGGLVATYMALHHPEYVQKLVTVASSPKFAAEKGWRGIQPNVLQAFTEQLIEDFQLTLERFMTLQAMGSPTARQDVQQLKEQVLSRPTPHTDALLAGLNMLSEIDFRAYLQTLNMPVMRLYGRLDGLVPVKVASALDAMAPNTQSHVFTQSSHAPFMTESEAFCRTLQTFILS